MDQTTTTTTADFDDDWEEWDGKSPFWVHCVAGSLAGVAEHVLVYPLDTVRTHIQVCASCNYNPATHNASTQAASMAANKLKKPPPGAILQQAAASASAAAASSNAATMVCKTKATATQLPIQTNNLSMLQAVRQLVSQRAVVSSSSATATATATWTAMAPEPASPQPRAADMTRLWRGVQTILVGCIPAHALYFSTYEIVKASTRDQDGNVTAWGSALAGGAAVFGHDLVLGPLDTVKQRLQLGHYQGLTDALRQMIRNEGAVSLLRSFPITLATNIPYGMIMVGTNEFLKDQWTRIVDSDTDDTNDNNHSHHNHHIDHSELTLGVTLGASSLAGLLAAATTTPLDRIKTSLQTQQLAPSCLLQNHPASVSPENCPLKGSNNSNPAGAARASGATTTTTATAKPYKPVVADWRQAALRIYRQEGYAGFFRGMTPRILSHTPAVAISWTTYETFKRYLQEQFCDE
mmetsp:Transcript_8339/g.24657  ORF Transcript_8339/g.24657 Transcript_8339/m.24657 type:complete len:465 (-) Transcript_8339:228-1622(-)